MVAPFLHFEVLGPRADLDAWLASLQDVGVCHLSDALQDLEGHAGIGRPELRAEEVHADIVRSEASRALRGVARVLPATPRRTPRGDGAGVGLGERRPAWTLGPGGVGERDLLGLKDEARKIAGSLGEALQRVHECESAVERLDALEAARGVLERGGATTFDGHVLSLPRSSRPAANRRLQRRLQRRVRCLLEGDAPRPLRATGERTLVVVPRILPDRDGARPSDEVAQAAAALGAQVVDVPAEFVGASLEDLRVRLARRLAEARKAEGESRAMLTARVGENGIRGRFLLDSLDDADRRTRARRHLAATEHVTAARLYVRPEDEPLLRERLHAAHGESVVLRPLAEANDAPSLPRRVAPAPFAVIDGLLPGRFGEVSPAALLALFAPLAVGLVWADVAGGIFLLLAGGLLGAGAGAGSPRRDTALLAQVGGLLALVLGVLAGRAFGPAGVAWFGDDWARLPGAFFPRGVEPVWAGPFLGVLWALGAVSALAGLWGFALALVERGRGLPARAQASLLGALHYAVIAGLAAATLPAGHSLAHGWVVAPAAAAAVLFLGGPRRFLFQLCLDLVGVLRLVAVAGSALLVFDFVLASWIQPTVAAVLLGILALLAAALAVVADPAHLAMGVPYDLALGGKRLSRPFQPFRRRMRRALSSGGPDGRTGAAVGES